MAERWPAFAAAVESSEPLGIWPLAPDAQSESAHNISMTFAYVLGRAVHGAATISVLDWGGGIGHYALMAQRLFSDVAFDVTVKDVPEQCRVGRELVPTVRFEETDDAVFTQSYDLVIASASLQYASDWQATTTRLVEAAA